MLVIPVLFGASCLVIGLDARSPDLLLGIMLQAVASPMMAAPAFAALMGLDATLVLVTLVTSSELTPFTAPLFAYAFTGPALTLSPLALGLKLFAILAGSAIVGFIIRRIAGLAAILRYKDEIDGVNILVVFVFVAAVMENVAARFFAAPMVMIGLAALAFMVFFAVLGLTTLLFSRVGKERALVLGLMASQRNMGLMLAATGGALPDLAWLYFALSQFPIYLSPQLLRPLVRRLVARSPITPENASQVSGLAEWGENTVTDIEWTPDGRILAVSPPSIRIFASSSKPANCCISLNSASAKSGKSPRCCFSAQPRVVGKRL
jgi:BASS family bile acid:Na+ symporter